MKKEQLYEILGEINEQHIVDARNAKKSTKIAWMKWIALAACLCFVILVLALYLNRTPNKDDDTIHASNNPTPEITITQQPTNTPEATIPPEVTDTPTPEVTVTPPVDLPVPETLQDLIAQHEADGDMDHLLATFFGIEDMIVEYALAVTDDGLENFIGEPFEEDFRVPIPNLYDNTRDFYYPKDAPNLKYLIEKTESGNYRLWEFFCLSTYDIENETYISYTYNNVLETIFHVHSADDIVSITTSPSKSHNTDLGKQIQQEVGTTTYTNPNDIQTIYNILVDVVYLRYYHPNIDSISYDQSRFTYSFSTEAKNKLDSGESTYGTRMLSIEFSDGTTLDTLLYDALNGSFSEGGYVYTVPLEDEDVYALNEIFGIQ